MRCFVLAFSFELHLSLIGEGIAAAVLLCFSLSLSMVGEGIAVAVRLCFSFGLSLYPDWRGDCCCCAVFVIF